MGEVVIDQRRYFLVDNNGQHRGWRRLRTLLLVTAVAVGVAVLIDRWVTPTHHDVVARDMLNAAIVPPTAKRVSHPPAGLTAAPLGYGCSAYGDQYRYWVVPGTVISVMNFLDTHVPPGMHQTGTGGITHGSSEYITVAPVHQGHPPSMTELQLSFAAINDASVGLRADGIDVPGRASCTYH